MGKNRNFGFILIAVAVISTSCNIATGILYPRQDISDARIIEIRSKYPDVKELSLVNQGVRLQGWYLTNGGHATNMMICFGGNAEEASTMIDLYRQLKGYDILFFNYRSYGRSGGVPSEKNLFSDALFIYDWAASNFTRKGGSITLVGRSLGSGIAVHTASLRKTRKLVLVTPYDSIERVARRHYPGWVVSSLLKDSYQSTRFIRQVQCPILMIVAGNDMLIPPEHAKALFEVTPEPKSYVTVQGSTHHNIYSHQETWTAFDRFLGN